MKCTRFGPQCTSVPESVEMYQIWYNRTIAATARRRRRTPAIRTRGITSPAIESAALPLPSPKCSPQAKTQTHATPESTIILHFPLG